MPDYSDVAAVFPLVDYAIVGVDTGTEEFVIDGDQTERFLVNDVFSVIDSTGNDGEYTVASRSYASGPDETTIVVNEDITDATVDGTILHDEKADTLPITEAHDDVDDRDAAAPDQYAGAHGQRLANEIRAVQDTVNIALGFEIVDAGGLVIYHSGGILNTSAGAPAEFAPSKLTLPDNDDSYIEVDTGGITSNITGFTAGKFPLAIVTTLAGSITRIQDKRAALGGGGAGGVPAPSVDNRLVRVNGVVGEIQQASSVLLDDNDYLYNLGRIGIGPDASPPLHPIHYQDDAITDAGLLTWALIEGTRIAGGAGGASVNDTCLGTTTSAIVDHAAGTYGDITALNPFAYLIDGTVGSGAAGRAVTPVVGFSEIDAGRIYGGAGGGGLGLMGAWFGVGAYGGIIDDSAVVYAYGEWDGVTVNGETFMYYADEIAGADWGYYQFGDADNYLGGALEALGIITATGGLSLGPPTELTIAAGVVTVTKGYHRIDTEADAATDDLLTISGGVDGEVLRIRAEDSARTVVAKDGTGNLALAGDFSLDNAEDTLSLIYDATLAKWLELSRSDNGA